MGHKSVCTRLAKRLRMYKRKKHREPLHHHRTPAEIAEQERLDAENATGATSTSAPTSFFGKLFARLQEVPAVKRAETLIRDRILERPSAHALRAAVGYAAKGRFGRAIAAIRRADRDPSTVAA